jgi:hypothetical protein
MDHSSHTGFRRCEAKEALLFCHRAKAKIAVEEVGGPGILVLPDCCTKESTHRMFGRQRPICPGCPIHDPWTGDQLEQQPIGIGERQYLLVEAAGRTLILEPLGKQPLDPNPSDAGGIPSATVATCPVPCRPRLPPGQGKKVRRDPG